MAGFAGIIRNLSLPLGMPQLPPTLPRNMLMPIPANSLIGNSNIRFPTPPASQHLAAAPAGAESATEATASVPAPSAPGGITVIGGDRAGLPTQTTEMLMDVLRGWRTSLATGVSSGTGQAAGPSTEEVGSHDQSSKQK